MHARAAKITINLPRAAFRSGSFLPVFCGAATAGIGVDPVVHFRTDLFLKLGSFRLFDQLIDQHQKPFFRITLDKKFIGVLFFNLDRTANQINDAVIFVILFDRSEQIGWKIVAYL